jgi:hypothetical protein
MKVEDRDCGESGESRAIGDSQTVESNSKLCQLIKSFCVTMGCVIFVLYW